jgi:ABC-type Fe3+ transport system substrate-binding protein
MRTATFKIVPLIIILLSLTAWLACDPDAVSAQGDLFNRLVEESRAELAKKRGKIVIGTDWTNEEAKPVLSGFKRDFPFVEAPSFQRLRTTEEMQRMLMEAKVGRTPTFDIANISHENWPEYAKSGLFPKPPYSYKALIKALPKGWTTPDPRIVDPQDEYMATTGLARGIAYNKNAIPADKVPKDWKDCLDPMWRGKVLYDPRPKLNAFQHDPKTRQWYLNWLEGLVKNKVVLGRGQTENIEKLATGEHPLFCGVNYYSTMRAVEEGAPLGFVLPDPFVMEFGVQIHVLKWSTTPATTQLFVLWLATKGDQPRYREFPWRPGVDIAPLAKGKYMAVCDVECLNKSSDYIRIHGKILGLPGSS